MKVSTFGVTAASLLLVSADALNIIEPRADPLVFGYGLNRRDASQFGVQVGNYFVRFHES
jgi:hypothetical protein